MLGSHGFVGVEYHPCSFDSKIVISNTDYVDRMINGVLYHIEDVIGQNDQICLTRQTGVFRRSFWVGEIREVEVVSTGVTKSVVEEFIQGSATEAEGVAVKKLLEFAVEQELNSLSASLSDICKLLLSLAAGNSIEVIKQILASWQPEKILKVLGEHTDLLSDEKITTKIWGKILKLSKQILESSFSYEVLSVLMKYPELLSNKEISSELWEMILLSSNPHGILEVLVEFPEFNS